VTPSARKVHLSNLEELDRISDIINNLLSLNVLIQPEEIPFKKVDIGNIARLVVRKLRYLIPKKGPAMRLHIGKEHIAFANAGAMEQILSNLIKNAIHHTPSGEIVVHVGANSERQMGIIVQDSGTGIRKEDIFRIFEPFYRGDRARSRLGGAGSGLGLAIVRELVRLHKGDVQVQSAPGKGTTVSIVFPMDE
jgi:two-component system phosphate regulon sensor histidine kinase PhoR